MDKSREKERVRVQTEVVDDVPKKRPFWQNAKLATVIVAVVCVLATVFGAHRSFASARNEVEQAFYQGVDGSGYSIWELYQDRAEYAEKLALLAEQYAGEVPALTAAAADCRTAVESVRHAASVGQAAQANAALTVSAQQLDLLLDGAQLSQLHAQYRSEHMTELNSYDQKVSHLVPDYQALVLEFDDSLSSPLGALATLTGVKPLEVHAFS